MKTLFIYTIQHLCNNRSTTIEQNKYLNNLSSQPLFNNKEKKTSSLQKMPTLLGKKNIHKYNNINQGQLENHDSTDVYEPEKEEEITLENGNETAEEKDPNL